MAGAAAANTDPVVSVVIIFFNPGDFLSDAIASVFVQRYEGWELLLVDDGSSDQGGEVARAVASAYPGRVRYLEHAGHANRGMSASRNLGIQHARGRCIALLDADDVWVPGTLEEQVQILEQHRDAAMVYGPLHWWYSWSGRAEDAGRDYVERLGVPGDALVQPPALVPLFLEDRAAVPSGILVRRETVEQVGGFEEEFRGEYEDQVFCVKVCLAAPVFAAARSWYQYRQHPGSAVARGLSTGATRQARRRFLRWTADYLTDQHIDDPEVWRAVRSELRRARYAMLQDVVATGSRTMRAIKRRAVANWKDRLGVERH